MLLNAARNHAQKILEMLAPACAEIMVCGSIRRGKEEVKDIEIVARPHFDQDLFGGNAETYSRLDGIIERMAERGVMRLDTLNKKNGPRYKRFRMLNVDAVLELFLASEDNWGNIVAIRTGNAEFSTALAKKRSADGLMPDYLRQDEGFLWRGTEKIPCRTEAEFFQRLRVRWIEPEARTAQIVPELRRVYTD